jgi:leucyl-tRNA synthetase
LGHTTSITRAAFPEFREQYLVESNFEYPVMINGKLRAKLDLPLTLTVPEIEKVALADVQTQQWLEGKSPKKIIIVLGKIVNLVV